MINFAVAACDFYSHAYYNIFVAKAIMFAWQADCEKLG
jgi:hypothetical protein